MSHTPGPWRVSNAGPLHALHIYHETSGDVLFVQPVHNCLRSVPNAALAAAAPEMKDLLTRMVKGATYPAFKFSKLIEEAAELLSKLEDL